MTQKLLVIGIDSLDSILLSKFQERLPTFKWLRERSPIFNLTGVQPPDSPVSWASIFTGVNPARHGVLEFVDPLEKTTMMVSKEIDNRTVRGHTFWDIAGTRGRKKVCVVLPPLGYPTWEVNGFMAGRASTVNDVQIYPSPNGDTQDLSGLSNLKGVIGRSPEKFIETAKALVIKEMNFTLELLASQEWDLFYTYSSALDPIQHGFWNHYDEEDPTHPKDSKFKGVIEEFYELYDHMVERYVSAVDPETAILVLSDHGHCMRPVQLLNVNEVLRREGLLTIKQGYAISAASAFERTKMQMVNSVVRLRLGNLALAAMRAIPGAKGVFVSPAHFDWGKTVAYLADLSGIKAYSYGGIIVRKQSLGDEDAYEEIRQRIITKLSTVKDPTTGKKYVKWICRREDLYSGDYISKYPDIVFRLQDKLGAGRSVGGSLQGVSRSHNIQPGSHNEETPIFYIANLNGFHSTRSDMTLMDVAPTVLEIMGVRGKFGFEGTSVLEKP